MNSEYSKSKYQILCAELIKKPKKWLITGVAGFIGSNLLETLLRLNQEVIGLDNFSTGYKHNLDMVKDLVGEGAWSKFTFVQGDIRDLAICHKLCASVDYVLHEAALGSVPRSIVNPILANENNITGFLNMLVAARDAKVKSFVYAASSSTYGDETTLPKVEDKIGKPLSPYAVTKYVNELYAEVFDRVYGFSGIGLRYFNVFGPRQDPAGAYAAVIPCWFKAFLLHEEIKINGDGETSRDFCYIDNCVQINILAACTEDSAAKNKVYNVAVGERTSLNELFYQIKNEVIKIKPEIKDVRPDYGPFREGDVRHSLADISLAKKLLGYAPEYSAKAGLELSAGWYAANLLK